LISVVAFAVFSVLALSGRFDFIEAKFYQPAVRRPVEQKINELCEQKKQYNQILIDRFTAFVSEQSVQTFTKSSATDKEVQERSIVCARLFSTSSFLTGLRIIDGNGRRIHYSTFDYDKKKYDNKKVVYEDYNTIEKNGNEPSFSNLLCPPEKKFIVYSDFFRKRIIYSIPLGGNEKAFAVFYCDTDDFSRYLLSKNLLTLSEKENSEYTFLNSLNTSGVIFGLPYRNLDLSKSGIEVLKNGVIKKIENYVSENTDYIAQDTVLLSGNYQLLDKIDSSSTDILAEEDETFSTEKKNEKSLLISEHEYVVFTKLVPNGDGSSSFISLVYDSEIFEVSTGLRILLLTLLFITLFLVIFLIFNLRHDDMVVIRDRIRRFQLAFITEYVDKIDNKASLSNNILNRKEELSQEIKKSLGNRGKKHSKEVDALLEKNWNEILSSLGVSSVPAISTAKASIDSDELRSILEEILGSGKLKITAENISAVQQHLEKTAAGGNVEHGNQIAELDEVEDVEDAEEIEELDDVEETEEVEEVENPEKIDEVEEVEEVESAEELENEEELEELEDIEEAESAEELEDIKEVENAEEAEELEDVEESVDSEKIETIEDADEIDDVDEIEELEDVDEDGSVQEIEGSDDAEEIEEIEDAVDAEEIEELEDFENEDEIIQEELEEEGNETDRAEVLSENDSEENVENLEKDDNTEDIEFLEDDIESLDEDISEDFEENAGTEKAENENSDKVGESERDDKTDEFKGELVEVISYTDESEEELMEFGSPAKKIEDDPESQKIVENFKVSPMDFSFLDDEEKEDENESFEEDVELDKNEIADDSSDNSIENFEEENLNESFENTIEQSVDIVEPSENGEKDEGLENLTRPQDSHPFLFTVFGANNNNITDLPCDNSEAIVEGDDGIFYIEGQPDTKEMKIDSDLKKLVDAVLK